MDKIDALIEAIKKATEAEPRVYQEGYSFVIEPMGFITKAVLRDIAAQYLTRFIIGTKHSYDAKTDDWDYQPVIIT